MVNSIKMKASSDRREAIEDEDAQCCTSVLTCTLVCQQSGAQK